MSTSSPNKVAIVTGGSRGIGRAIAERLARDGATVVINYAQNHQKAEETVAAIKARGGQALAKQGDSANIADVRRLFEQTAAELGGVDIVVANAGVFWAVPTAECTEEAYDRMFAINTRGVFFLLQQAARHLRPGGRIICISTGATRMAMAGAGVYSASKAAVEQFVRALAVEIASRGITVNTISPGFTDTDMLASGGSEFQQFGASLSPFKRLGTPEEIANAVSFLAGSEAAWLTGQNIQVSGGASMS
ncbi:MAG TPA: SDR family oxidoreductase [Pseudomonadota bacterium]|nr:SDR family oxidoreductase [Pseudomonadota bacterium]